MIDHEEKHAKREAQEVKEILGVVSTELPALIKGLLTSVFSEEAGTSMGKAAAAYYKQLKEGGLPEQVAVKLTEDYMRTFTDLGSMLKGVGRGKWTPEDTEDIGEEIERRIKEKFEKRKRESEEEQEEDDE